MNELPNLKLMTRLELLQLLKASLERVGEILDRTDADLAARHADGWEGY